MGKSEQKTVQLKTPKREFSRGYDEALALIRSNETFPHEKNALIKHAEIFSTSKTFVKSGNFSPGNFFISLIET